MSVSIIEALQNAEYNLRHGLEGIPVAVEQLHNAIGLLEKDYSPWAEIGPLLEQYGDVESVPENEPTPEGGES